MSVSARIVWKSTKIQTKCSKIMSLIKERKKGWTDNAVGNMLALFANQEIWVQPMDPMGEKKNRYRLGLHRTTQAGTWELLTSQGFF